MTSGGCTKTIIYYTSNRETPEFEGKIRDTILQNCGGLPIISVSQKPIYFGRNICIGEVGVSVLNIFRQILIGAREVETEYVIFAEADFLYPEDYFKFNPPGGSFYRCDNVWLVFKDGGNYCRKHWSNGAQVVRRDFLVEILENYLEGQPEWAISNRQYLTKKKDYNGVPFEYFSSGPCVSFKTRNGLTYKANFRRKEKRDSVDIWGHVKELKRKYL